MKDARKNGRTGAAQEYMQLQRMSLSPLTGIYDRCHPAKERTTKPNRDHQNDFDHSKIGTHEMHINAINILKSFHHFYAFSLLVLFN